MKYFMNSENFAGLQSKILIILQKYIPKLKSQSNCGLGV